jgi:hypothetical protein
MADAKVPELDADVGTGTEGDVEARCFSSCSVYEAPSALMEERDSPRDQLIVTFFLLIVVGLLVFQAIRIRCVPASSPPDAGPNYRLRKAVEARGRPTDLREWSEVRTAWRIAYPTLTPRLYYRSDSTPSQHPSLIVCPAVGGQAWVAR